MQNAYRRSLLLEPREAAGAVKAGKHSKESSRDKIELFPFAWGGAAREREKERERGKERERSGGVGTAAAMSFV